MHCCSFQYVQHIILNELICRLTNETVIVDDASSFVTNITAYTWVVGPVERKCELL